jgi:hypothetical protein
VLALLTRLHLGHQAGRHFFLWRLFHWGFRGPGWHPLVLFGGIAIIVVVLVLTSRGGGMRR